ncbi:MAG: prephenate/arogenate dehydrogenase family protein [bacterium]|nr:prephenate/arogenate dehydrogenase family protein [bacterium]
MADALFEKVALIGLGLIGSSLGHAMKRANIARHITGHARSKQTRQTALEIGFVDAVFENMTDAVSDADLVILCVPVGICGSICEQISPHLKQGAIVTDVGSVKVAVVAACARHIPSGVHFVPGHPMAGTEFSGPTSGFAELFDNRWCLLTPLLDGDPQATKKMTEYWQACGANVETMTAQHHDVVAAITSHLPHLIAFNIVGTADDLEDVAEREIIKYAAGGFRDFTRIAASDPTMWRDVFIHNKEAVLEVLGRFNEDLASLAKAIKEEDGYKLYEQFERTRHIRQNILDDERKK